MRIGLGPSWKPYAPTHLPLGRRSRGCFDLLVLFELVALSPRAPGLRCWIGRHGREKRLGGRLDMCEADRSLCGEGSLYGDASH